MRKLHFLLSLGLVVGAAGTAYAWGDDVVEIGHLDVPYRISSSNGAETGTVKYHLYLTRHIHEGGEASHWPSHPIDNRQCDWSIQGHMDRVVCFTSIMGGSSCNNDLKKNLPIDVAGQSGAPSNFFDHRPCSDFIDQINEQTNRLVSSIDANKELQADLNGDLRQAMQGSGVNVNYDGIRAE